jgi:AraC-like DNA-binding protein
VTQVETDSLMKACYDSMLPYFSKVPPPSESILELKFREFILNVLLNPKNHLILGYLNQKATDFRIPLQEIMEENYMHNLTLQDYSKISCRSLASFKREFLAYYHTTPGKWLIQKKLEHAKMLLDSTEKSISEIAFDSGFENNSHFSRIFKERYKLSPNFYRKKSVSLSFA